MVIAPRTVARAGFRCECCTMVPPTNGRGRDAERRALKRREREAYRRELRRGD